MLPNGSDVYINDSVSSNYSNLDLATVELFKGYPNGLLKFATSCCILFMMIGIPGNIITIIALARYEKIRNATALFIINLSCSDLLFCCLNLPLAASKFWNRAWTHGHIMCRVFPFARYTVVAVSLFTILAITINRYIIVAHPNLYPKIYKSRNIGIMIASIWIVSIGVLIPTWLEIYGRFGLDPSVGACSILNDEKNRSPKKSLFIGAFVLPCVVIILCYARIFFIVRKTTKKSLPKNKLPPKDEQISSAELSTSQSTRVPNTDFRCTYVTDKELSSVSLNGEMRRNITFEPDMKGITRTRSENRLEPLKLRRTALRKSMALLKMSLPTRKDRRLGTMIIAIMISFCVCHLPITITKVFVKTTTNATFNIVAYILLYLSSSINPVIYVLMSHEYRKAYKHLLKRRRKATIPITGGQRQA